MTIEDASFGEHQFGFATKNVRMLNVLIVETEVAIPEILL